MDLSTIEAFEASQMAILKAIRKAKKAKMEESGHESKVNVWVAWSKIVKSKYSDEYETEAEQFKASNDGKLFGFLGKFAKKMKETHSDEYESFKSEHAASSSDKDSVSKEKPKKAPKKVKIEEPAEKPKKTRSKAKKADSDAEEEKPKKRGRPAKKAVQEVASDDE